MNFSACLCVCVREREREIDQQHSVFNIQLVENYIEEVKNISKIFQSSVKTIKIPMGLYKEIH